MLERTLRNYIRTRAQYAHKKTTTKNQQLTIADNEFTTSESPPRIIPRLLKATLTNWAQNDNQSQELYVIIFRHDNLNNMYISY